MYVRGVVELVVDILLDDAGLPHALVAQEHQLVLCLVASRGRRQIHSEFSKLKLVLSSRFLGCGRPQARQVQLRLRLVPLGHRRVRAGRVRIHMLLCITQAVTDANGAVQLGAFESGVGDVLANFPSECVEFPVAAETEPTLPSNSGVFFVQAQEGVEDIVYFLLQKHDCLFGIFLVCLLPNTESQLVDRVLKRPILFLPISIAFVFHQVLE